MPVVGGLSKRVYGFAADEGSRALGQDGAAQRAGETIAADTRRAVRGPKANGHLSAHVRVTSAFGAGSTLTVYYSNLPDPDLTSDTDWVLDTAIAAIDLTAAVSTFLNIGNVNAEWVMFKVDYNTSSGALYLWTRVDGQDNR